MVLNTKLDRTQFLRVSAVAAVGTVVAACGGGAPAGPTSAPASQGAAPAAAAPTNTAAPAAAAATPTAAPVATSAAIAKATEVTSKSTQYKEAPMLADMVKAGTIPSVDKRLPEKPFVIPHPWLTTGKYGGHLQMILSDKGDWGTGHYLQESMYGHSHLRWLKDGLEIGPGLVESWETNKDQSEWTLHFRKGLKWSDGKPWSTDDIMFWWNDEVLVPDVKETPPDEAKSGKGTLMKMTKVDDTTITLSYDAPTPLTADRLAMWVKRGIGPRWMDPAHYLKQFHIKYTPTLDKAKWVDTFTQKRDFATNPDCPTLTGWMLKEYVKGQHTIWTRNPYYWAVDKAGNQLPYIDGVTLNNVQDPQVMKLQINQGKIDYVHGAHSGIDLTDVSNIKQAQATSKMDLILWDSGSGTGSMYFFNHDHIDPKIRAIFRNNKFLQAMSMAVDRADIQKSVYFNTGEPTTGTLSPKALEYHVQGGQEVYQQWRDSYVKYDPTTAKKLLDEIGMKAGADGMRTLPDGTKFQLNLDYTSDTSSDSEHMRKNNILVKNWQAIGINAKLNPVVPTSQKDLWKAGKLMMNTTWEVGDGPNHLVYPQWIVPLETSRWAPLHGAWQEAVGTPAATTETNVDPWQRHPPRVDATPNGPIAKIWDIYNQTKVEPDVTKRTKMVWDIIKIHISDGPFFSGTVNNTPRIVLVKQGLKNVPTRDDLGPKNGYQYGFVNPWIIPSPAVYDPETYYWDNPDQHK